MRRSRATLLAVAIFLIAAACTSGPLPPIVSSPDPDVAVPVSVLVLGPEGRVAGAQVCAARPGREERCANSGDDGRAVIELLPGTYAIRGTPAEGQRLEERVVTVPIGNDTDVTLVLRGRSTISGTVRDPEGRGVRGAEACAHATTSTDLECIRTGADGSYTIEIPPGIHKIHFTGPSDGSRLMPLWARAGLSSAEAEPIDTRTADVAGIDVALARGVVLSGTVTGDRDGQPLEEAQLCTYPLSAPLGWSCETTDRHGRYTALRAPDTYWIWAIPPDARGSRLIPERFDNVLVGVNATAFELPADRQLDMALPEGVVVSGTVTSGGEPVIFAFVCIDTPFPTGRICRVTDESGRYEVAVRPETYVLSVVPPDGSDVVAGYYPDAVPDWTKAADVPVGGDTQVDIQLPRGVILSGTIRDTRGIPVEAATINVNDATGPRFFAVTDMDGHYSVAVTGGLYTVDVFAPRQGSLLSVVDREVQVHGDTGYDVVMPDVVIEGEP